MNLPLDPVFISLLIPFGIFLFYFVYVATTRYRFPDYLEDEDKVDLVEKPSRLQINYPIGTKVILLSNEPYSVEEPNKLLIGFVSGVDYIGLSEKETLIFQDIEGNEVLCLNDPLIWDIDLENALNKLSWNERWNIYTKGFYIIDEETKLRKEKSSN